MKSVHDLIEILTVAPTSTIFDFEERKPVDIIAITTGLRDDLVATLRALQNPAKGIPQNDTHVVQDTSGQT